MNISSLEHKTIRPGSLVDYSYYHSNRQPAPLSSVRPPRHWHPNALLALLLFLVVIGLAVYLVPHVIKGQPSRAATPVIARQTPKAPVAPHPTVPAVVLPPAAAPAINHCATNGLDKLIKVSISQRHLWACAGNQTVQDSPVITGMLAHASTLTPPGTYHITGKTTDTVLTGSDETGSWRDPVSYWMPFLHNQYGSYGFHDATWRGAGDFGNIDPNSADASHGCVELPLSTAAWIYSWASTGTTVVIES